MNRPTQLPAGKRAYLLKLVQDVRASYWFLPSILVFVGLTLAFFMGWIDARGTRLPFPLPETLLDTQADGARSTLAVIAQSIIGVTGVMFSMTLVAVSFASGNFGPRLIGNFMRDRGNQWSLGILISTFVYALVVLRSVQDGIDGGVAEYVPQYSLIMALILTLLCVFTLIYFIHHVPETINVSRISAGIGAALEKQILDLIERDNDSDNGTRHPNRDPDTVITSAVSGYVQTVNFDQLSELAMASDWHVALNVPIGGFVTSKTPVISVWGKDLSDDDYRHILGCFAVGSSRTENQNPSFLAEQLVEMVARALSPGLNDPYTAIDCLNRMAAALTIAGTYRDGLRPPFVARVAFHHLTFARLLEVTFGKCRPYVLDDPLTLQHAQALLDELHETVRDTDKGAVADMREALKG